MSIPAVTHEVHPGEPLRVFLVEDHAITLWGLQRLVESRIGEMKVVGMADSRASLVNHPALPSAEVIVLDLDLADEDGLDALPDVQRLSQAQVLVLTGSEDRHRHIRAVEMGVKGIMHKSEAPQKILEAILQLRAGGAWLDPQLMSQVLGRLTGQPQRAASSQDPAQARIALLTPRELEVVRMLSRSPGDKLLKVAGALGMSENTLRNHLTTVYGKLGVRGRLELHVFATEHGLAAA
ncbi:MAG: response regulator transcription factor [Burkholderiaceae bacterium]